MAFGKRGIRDTSIPRPAFAAATPAAEPGDEPGLRGGFFQRDSGDDFDIDFSSLQPYGHDKSVIMVVLLWLFCGMLGGHRFYLGHWLIGLALLAMGVTGVVLIRLYINDMLQVLQSKGAVEPSLSLWYTLLAVGAVQAIWWLVDGIYVICRTLSARVGG